jgi:hypothetical protein
VLNDIATGVIGSSQLDCEWVIPAVPQGEVFDPEMVNVILTSDQSEQLIGQVSDFGRCANARGGWYYDDNANPAMVLACPESCAEIRATPNATMDLIFGCKTQLAAIE